MGELTIVLEAVVVPKKSKYPVAVAIRKKAKTKNKAKYK
jgi:hypothetical protein